jgi:hypothetical protein
MILFINRLPTRKKTCIAGNCLSRNVIQAGDCGDNSTGISCNNHVADFMPPWKLHAATD